MIDSQDRSGWFGASDTATIMGNWKTKTFAKWWMQKLGMNNDHFANRYMNAGTYYEHEILKAIGAKRMDHQIIIPEYRIRVNLDGDAFGEIYEVKTHSADKEFKVSKAYWQQVQVQIFSKVHEDGVVPTAQIVSYGLTEDDYRNFFNDIDQRRIKINLVQFDSKFIDGYLRRVEHLKGCLEKGAFPHEITD